MMTNLFVINFSRIDVNQTELNRFIFCTRLMAYKDSLKRLQTTSQLYLMSCQEIFESLD